MKAIRKLLRRAVADPIEEAINPPSMRITDYEDGRGARVIHYRYPSPASEALPNDRSLQHNLDFRVGYHDSLHSIRYEYNSTAPKPKLEQAMFSNPGVSPEVEKFGGLTRLETYRLRKI